jgi:DUF177 domain-containing protein
MERIDTRELGTEPLTVRWTGPVESLGLQSEPEFHAPVRLDVRVRRLGSRFYVQGTAGTTLRLACSRCLEPFEAPVETEVTVEFREGQPPAATDDGDGEVETDVTWFEPPFINLADDIRQILLVAVPGYPVCRETCLGLCPACGANRNEADCGHGTTDAAPREVLGALVDKEQRRHG